MRWDAWAESEIDSIRSAGRWRSTRDFDASGPVGALESGEVPVVSFASNDYLGLTSHASVRAAAASAIERWGTGSGSARLIVGSRPVHRELEAELADWKSSQSAVLFSTGYAANIGVLSVFATPGVTVLSDALNHASIIDGCRLGRAGVRVYRHRDVEHLEDLLDATRGPTVVVTEAVFSMDGDAAPLEEMGELCLRRGALLVVDEAHSVLGPELPDIDGLELLRVGTLSKTLGSLGGFVAGTRAMCDLIVNRARPYIFTTAPTPADSAAALAALHVLRSSEGDALMGRLRGHVERVESGHTSPIVPFVVGEEERTREASEALLRRGLLVPAIRPPTVPVGTSRLRVTLSAAHDDSQVDLLLESLEELGLRSSVRAPVAT
jgi:8-amino-7-oxononanoate synthase